MQRWETAWERSRDRKNPEIVSSSLRVSVLSRSRRVGVEGGFGSAAVLLPVFAGSEKQADGK